SGKIHMIRDWKRSTGVEKVAQMAALLRLMMRRTKLAWAVFLPKRERRQPVRRRLTARQPTNIQLEKERSSVASCWRAERNACESLEKWRVTTVASEGRCERGKSPSP